MHRDAEMDRRARLSAWGESEKNVDRVTAFSDGVFAIAITILVLQFEPPAVVTEEEAAQLAQMLWEQRINFASYVISFLILGLAWISHHRAFHYVHRIDVRFMVLNLVFLMCICFVPYPTNFLGDFAPHRVAVMFYACVLAACGLSGGALWWYAASNRELLHPASDPRVMKSLALRPLIFAAIFATSVIIAVFEPIVAMLWWGLIVVSAVVLRRFR